MNRLRPLDLTATAAALLGGAALIADVAIITARNASFGLADDALFLLGLAAVVIAAAAAAALVARPLGGVRRVLLALAVFAAIAVALTALSLAADALSHSLYSGGNRGLHGECGIFAMGIAAVAAGVWLARRSGSAATVA